ncbi:MAG: hypothetical protein V7L29_29025 [Nostoc sp.]|uniref:hypothetical protein n=1 Tax=Nostoc sp. TaxID=1180 RepID=UPI002FF88B44
MSVTQYPSPVRDAARSLLSSKGTGDAPIVVNVDANTSRLQKETSATHWLPYEI